MKTFREHINEEIKIGALASGGIDIERDAVRDEINGILAGIASKPCVTPYWSLNKIRKALSYFSIFLPKKVYLEGKHGVEVWEVKQFGDKMGFTDQGDWIHHVPAKYHLFFHYHRIGSMYYLEAKIVDENELEKRINAAEQMVAEESDAACRQDVAKHMAPKEPLHDVTSDEKKKGNKEAVSDSEKGLSEEMSHGARELATYADNHAQLHRSSHQPIIKNLSRKHAKGTYDHGKAEKLWGYHAKRASDAYHKEHGHKFSVGERKEAASHMAASARDEHGFGSVKEARMPASIIRHKQKLAKCAAPKDAMHDVTSDEKKKGNKEAVADSEKGRLDELYGKGKLEAIKKYHKEKRDEYHKKSESMMKSNPKNKDAKTGKLLKPGLRIADNKTRYAWDRAGHESDKMYRAHHLINKRDKVNEEAIDEAATYKIHAFRKSYSTKAKNPLSDEQKAKADEVIKNMEKPKSRIETPEEKKERFARNLAAHGGKNWDSRHMGEETQLDELKLSTVKSYRKAAKSDKRAADLSADTSEWHASDRALSSEKRRHFKDEAKWLKSISKKREKGIAMADKRLDEISKEKLADYIPAAAHKNTMAAVGDAHKIARDINHLDSKEYEKSFNKRGRRHHYIRKAVDRLMKKD